jgi:pheromone shutdown-related protein TraB
MPVEELVLGDKTVYLLGTAHVSDESVKAVEDAIGRYRPDVVAVELCAQRYQALKEEKKWDETEIGDVLKSDRIYLFLLQILLANFQRKIGDEIGVKPGAEMMKAIELAEKNNIRVVLADRDIKVTLKRAMDLMTFKEKVKLLYGFITGIVEGEEINQELIERLKEKDVLSELMEDLAVETPSVKKVLVDERDEYIAYRIHREEAERVLAVVGAGHVEGIKNNLKALDDVGVVVTHTHMMEGVEIKGVSRKKINAIAYGIPAVFTALIIWGFIQHGGEMTVNMLVMWFLIDGTLAAVGVLLAFGHPLSAAAAFISAPFATLNPAIAVGWIAGYVELKLRKPRVKDFKELMMLKRMSDYWRNRVTRIILVVAFANIGSTVGNLIALPYLASLI